MNNISFSKDEYKFVINENNQTYSFNCKEVIKYLSQYTNAEYFKDINDNSSTISHYLFTIENVDNNTILKLQSKTNSIFMNDIHMLVKLIQSIEEIKIIENIDNNLNELSSLINKFLCLILSHCLKLILHLIKNNNLDENEKKILLLYSCVIINKISTLTNLQIDKKKNEIDEFKNNFKQILELKTNMFQKMDDLNKLMTTQNESIRLLLSKLDNSTNSEQTINNIDKYINKDTGITPNSFFEMLNSDNKYNESVEQQSDYYATDDNQSN